MPPPRRSLGPSFGDYFWALLGATRPHFFALPIGAAFAGVGSTAARLPPNSLWLVALISGGGWASGQLLNDVLDLEADAIDAPDRAAVRGLLPPRTTIFLALAFGAALLLLLTRLTPHGLILGIVAMVLILTYNKCKALPALGNISHGALLACACLIGASIARPDERLMVVVRDASSRALLVGGWAALYLQGNYEKDMQGDAAAGYQTLAHILDVRRSALLRAFAGLVLAAMMARVLTQPFHAFFAVLGGGLIVASALRVAQHGSAVAALRGYRWTVHGAVLGMLALGGPALSRLSFLALVLGASLLTEWAFRRSANP